MKINCARLLLTAVMGAALSACAAGGFHVRAERTVFDIKRMNVCLQRPTDDASKCECAAASEAAAQDPKSAESPPPVTKQ